MIETNAPRSITEPELPGKNARAMLPMLEELAEMASEVKRYRSALNEIARHTGSDDPCRRLVDIARVALTVPNA